MINYSVRKRISRALSRAGIPEPLKFFLFGVSRRRRHSQRENLQCKDSLTAVNNTDESDIAIAIDRWASINSNIIRGFSMRSIATGLGLDISEVKDYFNNVSVEGFTKWRNRIRVRLASDLILQDRHWKASEEKSDSQTSPTSTSSSAYIQERPPANGESPRVNSSVQSFISAPVLWAVSRPCRSRTLCRTLRCL